MTTLFTQRLCNWQTLSVQLVSALEKEGSGDPRRPLRPELFELRGIEHLRVSLKLVSRRPGGQEALKVASYCAELANGSSGSS